MSRVCIVVLEEVDDDSPIVASKKLQEKYDDVPLSLSKSFLLQEERVRTFWLV